MISSLGLCCCLVNFSAKSLMFSFFYAISSNSTRWVGWMIACKCILMDKSESLILCSNFSETCVSSDYQDIISLVMRHVGLPLCLNIEKFESTFSSNFFFHYPSNIIYLPILSILCFNHFMISTSSSPLVCTGYKAEK